MKTTKVIIFILIVLFLVNTNLADFNDCNKNKKLANQGAANNLEGELLEDLPEIRGLFSSNELIRQTNVIDIQMKSKKTISIVGTRPTERYDRDLFAYGDMYVQISKTENLQIIGKDPRNFVNALRVEGISTNTFKARYGGTTFDIIEIKKTDKNRLYYIFKNGKVAPIEGRLLQQIRENNPKQIFLP